MSDNPNDDKKRASLRGKGWQILRGALRPDHGQDEEEALDSAAQPVVERPGAITETPVGSDALNDMMAAPEFNKLRDLHTSSSTNEFDSIDEMDEEFELGPLEAGSSETYDAYDEYEGEALPTIESKAPPGQRAAAQYEARNEVQDLIPVEPEFALANELFEAFAPEDDALLAAAGSPEVKAELRAATEEAVERGAFGAPTFFVGDEMFFGNDRLDFVERALMVSIQTGETR